MVLSHSYYIHFSLNHFYFSNITIDFSMQLTYVFNKWSTSKTIELKKGERAFLLGINFTPSEIIHSPNSTETIPFNDQKSVEICDKCDQINDEESTPANKSEKMLKIYTNTLLFTYRKNFLPLLDDVKKDQLTKIYTSDSGWGCMIRAGQMIFA